MLVRLRGEGESKESQLCDSSDHFTSCECVPFIYGSKVVTQNILDD